MRKVLTAGGLIMRGRRVRLVKRPAGYTLPKGHIKKGETIEQAALREVAEETGISAKILQPVGIITRPSRENTGEWVTKEIVIFLMEYIGSADLPQEEESEWVPLAEAANKMVYDQERLFLKEKLGLFDVAAAESDPGGNY